jgi:hypothetical protein
MNQPLVDRVILERSPLNMQFVAYELKDSKEFIKNLFFTEYNMKYNITIQDILYFISDRLKSDIVFMKELFDKYSIPILKYIKLCETNPFPIQTIKTFLSAYRYCLDELPIEIVMDESLHEILLENGFDIFSKMSTENQLNPIFIIKAIRFKPELYLSIGHELQSNLAIGLATINVKPDMYLNLAPSLKSNFDIVSMVVNKKASLYMDLEINMKSNHIIIGIVLNSNGILLEYMDISIRSSKKFVNIAISSNPKALQYASDDILTDKHFILKALIGLDIPIDYIN